MSEIPAELHRLRASLDNLDDVMIRILAERFKITGRIGELKAEHGLPPADPAREEEQVARRRAVAEAAGLAPEIAVTVLDVVVGEVVRNHRAIAERRES